MLILLLDSPPGQPQWAREGRQQSSNRWQGLAAARKPWGCGMGLETWPGLWGRHSGCPRPPGEELRAGLLHGPAHFPSGDDSALSSQAPASLLARCFSPDPCWALRLWHVLPRSWHQHISVGSSTQGGKTQPWTQQVDAKAEAPEADLCCHPASPKGKSLAQAHWAAALTWSCLLITRGPRDGQVTTRSHPPRTAPPRSAPIGQVHADRQCPPGPRSCLFVSPPLPPGVKQALHSFLCLPDGKMRPEEKELERQRWHTWDKAGPLGIRTPNPRPAICIPTSRAPGNLHTGLWPGLFPKRPWLSTAVFGCDAR